jgi:hypothetical protein
VQFKNDLGETNWTNFGESMNVDGGNFSITNNASAQTQRFFRILQLD